MSRPQTSPRVHYCSECNDRINPGEQFYEVAGRIICSICWGDP